MTDRTPDLEALHQRETTRLRYCIETLRDERATLHHKINQWVDDLGIAQHQRNWDRIQTTINDMHDTRRPAIGPTPPPWGQWTQETP
jgi:hypothetical protein